MYKLKPYRITYGRIGGQETWAGWQIAGQTENTPDAVLDEFIKLQDNNARAAGSLFENQLAREIFEWICKPGSAVYFTRLKYGMLDDAGGRPSMRADTVAMPADKDNACVLSPQYLLGIDKSCFDNRLVIDDKRDETGRLISSELEPEDANTVYPEQEYTTGAELDASAAIDKLFKGDFKKFTALMKCVYWALTFESASTFYIVMSGDLEDKFLLFSLIANSVVYSMREKLSFRTYDITASFPTTFVLAANPPAGGRYFNIDNGANNILTGALENKLAKNTFIENSLLKVRDNQADAYFTALEENMTELGGKGSSDTKVLNVADIFASAGSISDLSSADNKEIRRKLRQFLNLNIKSPKIDEYIADLMEIAIERKIPLDDDVQTLIGRKLSTTDNAKLQKIGYQYEGMELLNSANRKKSFSELYKLRKDDQKVFIRITDVILRESGGAEFMDSFYATCCGPNDLISTMDQLIDFCDETKFLPRKKDIINYEIKICTDIGQKIIDRFLTRKESLVSEYNDYVYNNKKVFTDEHIVSGIVNELKRSFWRAFSFRDYTYSNEKSYKTLAFRSERKSELCMEINEIFYKVDDMKPNSVGTFSKLVSENADLEQTEKNYLFRTYRKYCMSKLDGKKKERNIDFWIRVGRLEGGNPAEFMYLNRLPVFCSETCLEQEIKTAETFKTSAEINKLLNSIEALRTKADDKYLASVCAKLRKLAAERDKENRKTAKGAKRMQSGMDSYAKRQTVDRKGSINGQPKSSRNYVEAKPNVRTEHIEDKSAYNGADYGQSNNRNSYRNQNDYYNRNTSKYNQNHSDSISVHNADAGTVPKHSTDPAKPIKGQSRYGYENLRYGNETSRNGSNHDIYSSQNNTELTGGVTVKSDDIYGGKKSPIKKTPAVSRDDNEIYSNSSDAKAYKEKKLKEWRNQEAAEDKDFEKTKETIKGNFGFLKGLFKNNKDD